jgi:hypothetical protein
MKICHSSEVKLKARSAKIQVQLLGAQILPGLGYFSWVERFCQLNVEAGGVLIRKS